MDEQTLLEFFCECGDPTCRRTVVLTLEEYEQQRPDPVVHAECQTPRTVSDT